MSDKITPPSDGKIKKAVIPINDHCLPHGPLLGAYEIRLIATLSVQDIYAQFSAPLDALVFQEYKKFGKKYTNWVQNPSLFNSSDYDRMVSCISAIVKHKLFAVKKFFWSMMP